VGKHPRECTSTVLDGVRRRFSTSAVSYAAGASVTSPDESELAEALALAKAADVTVLVLGDNLKLIGETLSTATLELQGGQCALLEAVAAADVPFVLVLVCSKPLVLPSAADKAQAVICCFNPGMQGGQALAELLAGDFSPSGKLPISFPRHVGQQPVFYCQVPGQHGQRYADLTQEPRYCFGDGLSYTQFKYSETRVLRTQLDASEDVELEFTLENCGTRPGTEIAQVYLEDLVTSVTWPTRRLVAFQRETLEPGERRQVRLRIPNQRLALVDAYEQSVVEPGEFDLLVGGSSRSETLERARFVVRGEAFSFGAIPGVLG
jgi:beta-glucosidase